MMTKEVQKMLFQLQDVQYRDFQSKLIPTVEFSRMIGVRTPDIRKLAKEICRRPDVSDFLNELPHSYFDEDQLHAFILNENKDFHDCMELLCRFLPYINNWATCDQLSPKVFKKHHGELLVYIKKWLKSKHVYTIRFGIGMLMHHFLDDDFEQSYPEMVSRIHSDEYYVNMMIAWYFATALAKQYESVISYFEEKKLGTWTHHKAIQKSLESYRIPEDHKQYLWQLK